MKDIQWINGAGRHKVMSACLRTGQITCHDASGLMIDCTGSRQDADFRSGVSWPAPRFEALDDTVLDRLTGLVGLGGMRSPFGRMMKCSETVR